MNKKMLLTMLVLTLLLLLVACGGGGGDTAESGDDSFSNAIRSIPRTLADPAQASLYRSVMMSSVVKSSLIAFMTISLSQVPSDSCYTMRSDI